LISNADVHYLSSCTKSTGPKICNSDVIGIGNSGLDHPYQKVEVGKEEFKHIVQDLDIAKQDDLIEKLINFLKSKKRYAKGEGSFSLFLCLLRIKKKNNFFVLYEH